jgi:hypothetical protein
MAICSSVENESPLSDAIKDPLLRLKRESVNAPSRFGILDLVSRDGSLGVGAALVSGVPRLLSESIKLGSEGSLGEPGEGAPLLGMIAVASDDGVETTCLSSRPEVRRNEGIVASSSAG